MTFFNFKHEIANFILHYQDVYEISASISKDCINTIVKNNYDSQCKQNFIACAVCELGVIFSMLWIMMAKGSKMWQEKYEGGIDWFVWESELLKDIPDEAPYHGNLKINDELMSESLFSTKGGRYSVSRINCCIGIVALIIWSFLSAIHFGTGISLYTDKSVNNLQCAMLSMSFIVLTSTVVYALLYYFCRSGKEDAEK